MCQMMACFDDCNGGQNITGKGENASYQHFLLFQGVLRGSLVKCLTCNPGVLGSSRTGSSGFFRWSVLGQDISESKPTTGETQERHE